MKQLSKLVDETRDCDVYLLNKKFVRELSSKYHVIPINSFKDPELMLEPAQALEQQAFCFRSSGTTSSERSWSRFSPHGIKCYQKRSTLHFETICHEYHLDPHQGYSFIPNILEWPESSLAQMIDWFHKKWGALYIDHQRELPDSILKNNKKSWVFGTALHFYHHMKNNSPTPLGPSIKIIETGGFKGQDIQLERKEFYRQLCAFFSIQPKQIISEYGMCEFAAQAYGQVNNQYEVNYKFDLFCQVRVQSSFKKCSDSGYGALIVNDKLRVDAPYYIRTEDYALLDNGRFKLLGRLPRSELKGCSLNVDELNQEEHTKNNDFFKPQMLDFNTSNQEINVRYNALKKFLGSPSLHSLWLKEFGHNLIAEQAQKNMIQSLPKNIFSALENASHNFKCPKKWCFILPNNHSIVGFYPLSLAWLLGLNVTVKLGHKWQKEHNALLHLIDFLNKNGGNITTTIKRAIDLKNDPQIEAILAYGSNQTINKLQQKFAAHVKGFGERFFVHSCKDINKENLDRIIENAFALGQSGCMSTRAILSETQPSLETLANLENIARKWLPANIPNSLDLGKQLEHEDFTYLDNFIKGSLTFPTFKVEKSFHLDDYFSKFKFILPILVKSEDFCQINQGPFTLTKQPQNYQKWDGFYFKQRLFS